MIVINNAPCSVRHVKAAIIGNMPVAEIRISLPEVDPSSLVGVWPDVEKFCETAGQCELRGKSGGPVLILLRSPDTVLLDGQASLAGNLNYERSDGVGTLTISVVTAHPVDGTLDLWSLLTATECSIEPEPDPQQELFT